MKKKIAVCPISHEYIDENVARLSSFSSLILVMAGCYFNYLWIFLAIDFLIRSFHAKFSPLAQFNHLVVVLFKLKPKKIDIAPKKFAAKIGFIMSFLIVVFNFLSLSIPLYISITFLIFAAALSSFLNYCLGCKIYSFMAGYGIIKLK